MNFIHAPLPVVRLSATTGQSLVSFQDETQAAAIQRHVNTPELTSFGPAYEEVPFSQNVLSFLPHAVTKRHDPAGHSALEIE